MRREAQLLAALTVLAALRLIAGALLPLSADEAYYWLWSRHLAAGYFDHPPAIAYVIRIGTAIFGTTPFGVRAGGILLSFIASVFVWRTGAILGRDEKTGALACLFFNLTLMITVETLAATPDAPSIATSAAFFWTLAKVAETRDGRWWLAAGLAAGLGLLSKYSAFFLGLGTLVWLVTSERRWLVKPWPYLGGLVALLVFAPNLVWNAQHGWETFLFQFARIEPERLTLRFLGEFLAAQIVLASPFVFALGVMGLGPRRLSLVAAMLWPAIAYFVFHSLHDRVQGNWPCFLYPLFAVAAADAAFRLKGSFAHWSKRLAVPVAALLLVAGYAQALMGVVPMGRKDPLARLLAVGFPQVVTQLDKLRAEAGADAVITTDYASTGWFTFYGHAPVVDLDEDFRWPDLSPPPAALFAKSALYVTEARRDRRDVLAVHFSHVTEIVRIDRQRDGIVIAHYVVYRVSGLKTAPPGRMP